MMTQSEVVALMKSSRTASAWDANCDEVKKAFGGYPDFWFAAIILSGIAAETANSWGGTADITIEMGPR